MNLQQAYSILEIPQTSTPEEAKKKYRDLTKKFHPDVNKDPGAEDKFKKINEAYQIVSSGKGTDKEPLQWQRQSGFNPFGNQHQVHMAENIDLFCTISFKDAVLGCKKELKFNRNIKCKACNGQGEITLNNGCKKCGGRGQIIGKNGNMVFAQTCDSCFGKSETKSCSTCKNNGFVDSQASIEVNIIPGRQNGDILRLAGMGHYFGAFGPFEQNTDAHLHITVTAEKDLFLDGMHVVTNLNISLLDAINGCKKTVKTIDGEKEVEVKPLSKNKEEVIVPKLGVNREGNQRVILEVQYPEDISSLVSALS